MTDTIYSRSGDKRLIVAAQTYARKMIIGTSWNSIRIGARFSTEPVAVPFSVPYHYIGVCDSVTANPATTTTAHFLGWGTPPGATYTTNETNDIFIASTAATHREAVKIVGGIRTAANMGASSNYQFLPKAGFVEGMWIADITKGSPNFTVKGWCWTNGNASITEGKFAALMNNATISISDLSVAGSGTAINVAIDEATNGYFDHIVFSWGHATTEVELSDFDYRRLS